MKIDIDENAETAEACDKHCLHFSSISMDKKFMKFKDLTGKLWKIPLNNISDLILFFNIIFLRLLGIKNYALNLLNNQISL